MNEERRDDDMELERDVLAIECFVRLYASEMPSLSTLRARLAKTPKWAKRDRVVRSTYLAIAEGAS